MTLEFTNQRCNKGLLIIIFYVDNVMSWVITDQLCNSYIKALQNRVQSIPGIDALNFGEYSHQRYKSDDTTRSTMHHDQNSGETIRERADPLRGWDPPLQSWTGADHCNKSHFDVVWSDPCIALCTLVLLSSVKSVVDEQRHLCQCYVGPLHCCIVQIIALL